MKAENKKATFIPLIPVDYNEAGKPIIAAATDGTQAFTHKEFGTVRLLVDSNGDPLFCLPDICRVLGLRVDNVINRLKDAPCSKGGIPSNSEVISKQPIPDALGRIQLTSFVNEDGFFDTVLDSRKPFARRFRKWITHDVLPSIRKTGSYSVTPEPHNQMNIFNSAVTDIGVTAKNLQAVFGVKQGIALAKATAIVGRVYNIDTAAVKELLPPADHDLGLLNPTQIGKATGLNARVVNIALINLGYQDRLSEGGYRLTELGKQFGEAFPFEKNGHTGYQIRWQPAVISKINQYFNFK